MNITIQKIETSGKGIQAYRVVPAVTPDAAPIKEVKPQEITDNARRFGDYLRAQFSKTASEKAV